MYKKNDSKNVYVYRNLQCFNIDIVGMFMNHANLARHLVFFANLLLALYNDIGFSEFELGNQFSNSNEKIFQFTLINVY